MTKPNERPAWFPAPHKDIQYNAYYGWEEALDAVLKAADEHGIVFVDKEDVEELHRFSEWVKAWG